jgi:K+-sensing histidine kinase KdpD
MPSAPSSTVPVLAAVAAVAGIDVVPMILEVVCRTTGLGFSAVARVTESQWIACAVRDEIGFGLKVGGELKLETTICNEIRQSGQLVAIDHVAEDPAFCRHPTPAMYGFQSYISVPIELPDGAFFGTLCAIDPRPSRVNTPEIINTLKLFANLIGLHLESQDRLGRTELALHDERARAELREQFVAVLGHDLRNPLSAIQNGAALLEGIGRDERVVRAAQIIDRACRRMTGLIDDVLDFARGRLGGGLGVTAVDDGKLGAMIEQVVTEMRTARPDREIQCDVDLAQPVYCDSPRIGQLLSNLVGNALLHGDARGPVRVHARSGDGRFELSVANTGQPISAGTLERLGLYIAAEIARAHNGTLTVSSTPDETLFTFRMPAGITPRH